MLSCYTLLAIYLSTTGSLNAEFLEQSYSALNRTGAVAFKVSYAKNQNNVSLGTILINTSAKKAKNKDGAEVTVDKCDLKGKTYYGSWTREVTIPFLVE